MRGAPILNKFTVYYGEYSLWHWISMILNKDIVIPPYQRYFVWQPSMALQLMIDIKEGSFVPPVLISSNTENGKKVNYILDGQQRLSSILLTYLGIWPKPAPKIENLAYSEDDNEEDTTQEEDVNAYYEWTFSRIQQKFEEEANVEKLKRNLLETGKYIKISDLTASDVDAELIEKFKKIDFDSSFLKNCYLGFSYIIENSGKADNEKILFSRIFRSINSLSSRTPLTNEENRAALYWLNPGRKDFFQPAELADAKIGNSKIDFARFLAFTAQASELIKDTIPVTLRVAVGYGSKLKPFEAYISAYVSYVVNEADPRYVGKNLFCKFKSDFIKRMTPFCSSLKKIKRDLHFKTITEADYYIFGLLFWLVFKGKDVNLDDDRIQKLSEKIASKSSSVQDTKSVGKIGPIRERLRDSIEIYRKFLR